jgi:hypothetical protein
MEITRSHKNLSLFQHFGASAENENNTTRAFLIALSRSAWSPVLMRGFFDLIAEKASDLPAMSAKLLTAWPARIEMSLERDISAEKFPGGGVRHAILVDLTPVSGAVAELPHADIKEKPTGRVDATIVLTAGDDTSSGSDGGLAIVIESKLYGIAAEQQMERYKKAIEEKQIQVHRVPVAWEEIYDLTRALPNEAEHDPIVSDFKEFLLRDPRLTGFTGFEARDFSPKNERLDDKLSRFCTRVLEDLKNDPYFQSASKPERKKGGLDYDLLLAKQNQLVGNLGVAAWEHKALSAKLVVGWRGHWQTDRLLSTFSNMQPSERAVVGAIIDALGKTGKVNIDAALRPFFHRFDYDFAGRCRPTEAADHHAAWDEIVQFSRQFHGQPLTAESRAKLRSNKAFQDPDEKRLDRAFEKK